MEAGHVYKDDELLLSPTRVPDEVVLVRPQYTFRKHLDLREWPVSDETLASLLSHESLEDDSLTSISICGSTQLSDIGLQAIAILQRSIVAIDLSRCPSITSAGVCLLSACKRLRSLSLSHNGHVDDNAEDGGRQ